MPRSLDLNDVRLLMQVIDHGGYTAASRALGVPKSTISQRIAGLERSLGIGLLRRSSRSVSLTEAGSLLLPHARALRDVARQAEQALLERDGDLAGTLRVSCSSTVAQFALSPLLPRFLAEHGRVTIRIEASSRCVDLIGEGFDMAIRAHAGPLPDSSLRQRVLAHVPWLIVAAPDWLQRSGRPDRPEQVPAGQVLCFSTTQACHSWELRRGAEQRLVWLAPRLISDDLTLLRSVALAGGGLACLPGYLLRDALRTGTLVRVLEDWSAPASSLSVLSPPRPQSSRLAAAFSVFLAGELPGLVCG